MTWFVQDLPEGATGQALKRAIGPTTDSGHSPLVSLR